MRGRRIVLATLGSLGDLHPMIALGLGLQARGHEVTIATTGDYRSRIEQAGLACHALRPAGSLDDAPVLRRVMDPIRGPEYLIRTLLMPHLRDTYEDLLAATSRCDFLVAGEIVFAAPLVAEVRNLPWAAVILAPFSFFSSTDAPVLGQFPFSVALSRAAPWVQRTLRRFAEALTTNWVTPVRSLRRSLGLRATRQPLFRDRFSPYLNLALFSATMGAPQPDWPAHTVQTGFVFYDAPPAQVRLDPALPAFLDDGPPPIVFTLGSAAVMNAGTFFNESVEAARLTGKRAVLLMGNNALPQGDSRDVICAQYAPYSQVFPRSVCAVHQGGIGTTAQALQAASPQLVMPFAFDQPDNARRVERAGVGLSIRRDQYQAQRVARKIQTLLAAPEFSGCARAVAQKLAGEPALAGACDAIERQLGR